MTRVLDVRDVTVVRDGRAIVDHVDWSVDEGQRWVILGPNGAGKTTLMRMIAGRLFPTTGQVSIIGHDIGHTDITQLLPLVGFASSALDQRIHERERVLDVVRSAAYGVIGTWREQYDEEDDARAHELLAALGVDHIAQRRWGTLSSGERKRVGIARALMPDPEILILDEPASGLDLGGREHLMRSLSQLAHGRFAPVIVLISHHVEEIPAGFTHAMLMKEGRVHASGTMGEVLTSAELSEVFEVPVQLEHRDGRFVIYPATP
ncbi:ABC transporter ATP-binding protein [Trueperella sp. LYQ143]|uniref:ABC transporter ATP-binding protein n=1 Tax=unclassified Trueperella TaxID=2630174 RepID=UPI003983B4F2